MQQHVIVISYDAFGKTDWAHAKKQPVLQKLIQEGCFSTEVQTVYPSLTYVIHSSYVTGTYPNKHGIYHNNPLQPFVDEQNQAWHWYRKQLQGKTIYEALQEKGLTVSALLWPVTGNASIRYNLPEVRAINGENQALKVLKTGSPLYALSLELKHGKLRQGIAQPYLDNFTTACIVDTIKKKRPNLLLAHLIDLDDTKHLCGIEGLQMHDVIERMDRRLGDIVQAVEEAGMTDRTTFLIIGDHSQLEVRYKIHANTLLQQHGLIYEEDGEWRWRAYVQAAGGSAHLFIAPGDTEAEEIAIKLFKQVIAEQRYGIEALYDRQQLDEWHVASNVSYMLEAAEGYCFDEALYEHILYDVHANERKYATHGYHPAKEGYTSNFVASGANIKKGVEMSAMSVVDLAPTIAHLLGIRFDCDGRILREIMEI